MLIDIQRHKISFNERRKKIREDLLHDITNSNITFERKMKLMRLLDKTFRKYLGVIYLSDAELESNDFLNRSM